VAEIVTRTLSADHITPVRAYATLRSHVKERSSFLLESIPVATSEATSAATSAATSERGGGGRYSIVGYRVRREAIYPGGGIALDLLESDIAGESSAQSFAARMAESLVGFLAYDIVHAMNGIDPWPDEGELARMMRDTTVVVFDNATQTLTIAGPTKAAVDRCEWEMTHGPELPTLRMPDPNALPRFAEPVIDDAAFTAKVGRATTHVDRGDASWLLLARAFRAPMRGSDPFDVYRALRVLSPSRFHFFLEYGEMPIAEGFAVVGSSSEVLARVEDDDGADAPRGGSASVGVLRSVFPADSVMGAPKRRVSEIIRELEVSPRRVWGGVVGYASPGGNLELAVARTAIVARRGWLEVLGGARVEPGTDPEAAAKMSWDDARPALAAIRAAQDLAEAREEAEAAARAKAEAEARAAEEATSQADEPTEKAGS
jgi:anthranilate synthase component I